jgi:hypothetical protein
VTEHAIARYRERIDPRCDREQALEALIALSLDAHLVREEQFEDGRRIRKWRGRKPLRLRATTRESEIPGALPCLLTVLPEHDGMRIPVLGDRGPGRAQPKA